MPPDIKEYIAVFRCHWKKMNYAIELEKIKCEGILAIWPGVRCQLSPQERLFYARRKSEKATHGAMGGNFRWPIGRAYFDPKFSLTLCANPLWRSIRFDSTCTTLAIKRLPFNVLIDLHLNTPPSRPFKVSVCRKSQKSSIVSLGNWREMRPMFYKEAEIFLKPAFLNTRSYISFLPLKK